jgi:hypothetical protein
VTEEHVSGVDRLGRLFAHLIGSHDLVAAWDDPRTTQPLATAAG